MNYLKKKNRLFYAVAKDLFDEGRLNESLFLLEAGGSEEEREFFSLLGLYFDDEGGYQRALFIPLPLVKKSRSKGARILREALGMISDSHIVSRNWHDMRTADNNPPNDYYPPLPTEEVEEEYGELNNF